MNECPNLKQIAFRHDAERGYMVLRLRCKSWRCPYCAIENQKMWRKHLKRKIIHLGGTWYFGTITAPAWNRTPTGTMDTIRLNFDRFMKRLRRIWKHGVNYVRIYEKHKDGAFHLHIVISGLSPRVRRYVAHTGSIGFKPTDEKDKIGTWAIKTWWKKTLAKCGCGYIADIKHIPAVQAIGYVTNYMTKQAQDYHVPNLRRIQTSRGVGSPNKRSIERWEVVNFLYGGNVDYEPFIDVTGREKIPAKYWLDHVVFPENSQPD